MTQRFVDLKSFGRVSVSWAPEHQDDAALLDATLGWTTFQRWCQTLASAGETEKTAQQFTVEKIELQSVDKFGSTKIGFVKMRVLCKDKKTGAAIPGITVLRGSSVAILPVFTVKETGERYVLFVSQPRMPLATFQCVEIPAGMLDGSGDFAGKAAEEIEEETGMTIKHDDLVDLNASIGGDVYLSGGLLDESMRFFAWEKDVDAEFVKKLAGKETGLREHGEIIVLHVSTLDEARRTCRDSKFWISLALYESFKATGRK